jgi:ribosomal protein S18 acetylase RimI-like enzyme
MNDRAPAALDTTLLHRLEEASLNASAPPQQLLIDGWLVRFCPGKAKRARSVNAISAGRLPLTEKLALCQRVYDEAELPFFIRVTPFSEPVGLDSQLEAQGLRKIDDTRVMVCADPARNTGAGLPAGMVLQRVGLDAFAQTVGALRGSPLAQRQAQAQRLANSPVPFFAAVLKRDGEIVACGQIAIEGDMVGLYDIFTAPAARGQGMAGLLCRQLLADAISRGAKTAYLQVDAANAPARALYDRMGFIDAYAYHYRTTHPTAA